MLIVGTDVAAVEADLACGGLACPVCGSGLRPWGHGVEREVRLTRDASDSFVATAVDKPLTVTR